MNELDRSVMLALNFDGGPVMDAVMWFASGIPNWIPLYLAVLYIVTVTTGGSICFSRCFSWGWV